MPTAEDGSLGRIGRADQLARRGVIVLIILNAAYGTYAVRGLYADGSYYLWNILERRSFFFLGPSRATAQFATQLPVVAAINLGVNNVAILARLQSFGTVMIPMMVWALALFVLFKSSAFWPFVACFAVTFLNSGFFSVGEFNFAVSFVALSAALLIRGDLTRPRCIALLVCAVMLPLSYECLVFLGPLLILLSILRLSQLSHDLRLHRWPIYSLLVAGCLYLIATVLAAFWILHPRDGGNLSGAANLMWPIRLDPGQLTVSGILAGLYVAAWLLAGERMQLIATITLGIGSLALLVPALWSPPWLSYISRSDTCLAFFGLVSVISVAAILRSDSVRQSTTIRYTNYFWIASFSLVVVLFVPFIAHTWAWTQWVSSFQTNVITKHGFQTDAGTVQKFDPNSLYVSSYTNPALSQLLTTGTDQGIILSPTAYTKVTEEVTGGLTVGPLPQRFYLNGPLF